MGRGAGVRAAMALAALASLLGLGGGIAPTAWRASSPAVQLRSPAPAGPPVAARGQRAEQVRLAAAEQAGRPGVAGPELAAPSTTVPAPWFSPGPAPGPPRAAARPSPTAPPAATAPPGQRPRVPPGRAPPVPAGS